MLGTAVSFGILPPTDIVKMAPRALPLPGHPVPPPVVGGEVAASARRLRERAMQMERTADWCDDINHFRAHHPETPLPRDVQPALPGDGNAAGRRDGDGQVAVGQRRVEEERDGQDRPPSRTEPHAEDRGSDEAWKTQASRFDEDKDKTGFRDYENACERVKGFYRTQHARQTVEYNLWARRHYLENPTMELTVWEALLRLNELVDESDPDTELSQLQHGLQASESARRDGRPDWFVLTCFIHDMGKMLCFKGAEQWEVVGDTFIVGARPGDENIYPESFSLNPDYAEAESRYNTQYGMYKPHVGLDSVMCSWGHDEYLFHILKRYSRLPEAALDMVRFHSCYPLHSRGAYTHLMAPGDEAKVEHCKAMNSYDLYSKDEPPVDVEEVKEYYLGLIDTYFVGGRDAKIAW